MDMKIVRRGQINTLKMIAQDKQGFEKCSKRPNQCPENDSLGQIGIRKMFEEAKSML